MRSSGSRSAAKRAAKREDGHEEPAEHEDHAGHQDGRSHASLPSRPEIESRLRPASAVGRAGRAACAPLVGGAQEDRSTDRRRRGLEAEDARGEDGSSLPPRGEDDQRGEHEDGGRDGDPDRPPGAGSGVRGRAGDDAPLGAARGEQERRDEADPAPGAHEQRAQVPTRSRRWVRTWNPVRRATRVERRLQLLLHGRGHLEVGHVAAGRADQVVVVVREVLGQLVASELVRRHDPMHHAGPLEHGEVPIGGALGQTRMALEELRDGEGLVDGLEQVDQRAALRRVALAVVAQPACRGRVEIQGHQWWGWSSRISVCSPTRRRCPP